MAKRGQPIFTVILTSKVANLYDLRADNWLKTVLLALDDDYAFFESFALKKTC